MREEKQIDIIVDVNLGKKQFTAYTMDLTKKYIEINSDYRSWGILNFKNQFIKNLNDKI